MSAGTDESVADALRNELSLGDPCVRGLPVALTGVLCFCFRNYAGAMQKGEKKLRAEAVLSEI
jgi:hypothetical protein